MGDERPVSEMTERELLEEIVIFLREFTTSMNAFTERFKGHPLMRMFGG